MEPVRTGLRQMMSSLLRACPPEEAVPLAWPLICGKEVAARTRAVRFEGEKLTVEVPDNEWRSQLQSFSSRYITEYTNLFGELVKGLRFEVTPPLGK